MNNIPLQAIIIPVLGIAFVLYYVLVMRKRQIGKADQTNASYRAGALAERLGLTLVKGDPAFNLSISMTDARVRTGARDNKPVHVDILMQGEKDGVALELRYLLHQECQTDYANDVVHWKTAFECCMRAQAKRAFPEFEVTSRVTSTGPIVRMTTCPEASTGVPGVDAAYLVATAEPAMAKLLANHMAAFAEFHVGGVHLVGDGQAVSFQMRESTSVQIAYGLYYPESMAKGLVAIARAVGG
jgi:hypothetical protein